MASKSKIKSKTKIKLKRHEFLVEGKIIDLKRFAIDVFSYSAAKFGVPDGCILKLQEGENDYVLPDFIFVLSRLSFIWQVKGRNLWYKVFKSYYESTKFKTLESIQDAIQKAFKTVKNDESITDEVIATLAVMSELFLFLYTENCSLHLEKLGKFWSEIWCIKKKALEKAGGLVGIYQTFNNPRDSKLDLFFNEFIPIYCIPYDGSRELQNVYDEELKRFFNITQETLDTAAREVQETTASRDALRELASQLSTAHEAAQKPRRNLRADKTPRNTGLRIHKYEDLLGEVLGTVTKTSPNTQSEDNQKSAGDRRSSAGKKKTQKKPSSLLSTVAVSQPLKSGIVGAEASLKTLEGSESEAPRNTGLGILKREDVLRGVLGTDIKTSPNAQSKSDQKSARNRKGSAGKRGRQKNPSSLLSTRPLESGVVGSEASLKTLDEDSESETPRNTDLGIQYQDELLRHIVGTKTASPEDVSSKQHQKTAKNRRGSSTQKKRWTKKSSLGKMGLSPEQSHTVVKGAEAAAFLDEDSDNETFAKAGLGIQTREDILRDQMNRFVDTNIVSSEEAAGLRHQITAKDRKGSASKKKNRKTSSPESERTEFCPLDFMNLPAPSHLTFAQDNLQISYKDLKDRTFPVPLLPEDAVEIERNADLEIEEYGWIWKMDLAPKLSATEKEKRKKITIPGLTEEESECVQSASIAMSQFRASQSHQGTEKEKIGSSSQRSSKEDHGRLETCPLGAEASTSSKTLEDSRSDEAIISGMLDIGKSESSDSD